MLRLDVTTSAKSGRVDTLFCGKKTKPKLRHKMAAAQEEQQFDEEEAYGPLPLEQLQVRNIHLVPRFLYSSHIPFISQRIGSCST